eukprot:3366631-Rhodomonas_salina.2
MLLGSKCVYESVGSQQLKALVQTARTVELSGRGGPSWRKLGIPDNRRHAPPPPAICSVCTTKWSPYTLGKTHLNLAHLTRSGAIA